MQNDQLAALRDTATTASGPNYLAAFLLTLFIGFTGAGRAYLGQKGLPTLMTLLLIAPIFAAPLMLVDLTLGSVAVGLAGLLTSAALLWWYVDMWIFYIGKTLSHKSTRASLIVNTPADKKTATALFVGFHAAIVVGILLLIGLGFAVAYYISTNPLFQMLGDPSSQQILQNPEQLLDSANELGI